MYTQEVADRICAGLAEGKSLRAVCEAPGMPAESTVRAWALDDVEGFAAQYARAREIGYERLADELLEIADTPKPGIKTKTDGKGEVETSDGDMIEHRRLQVDARKWMLAKMLPKKYGDRQVIAGDPDAPWPVRRGGWILRVYEHSLGLAFVLLFLVSWIGHALGGLADYAADQAAHHQPPPTLTEYLTSARFWFESFQNWQSEFLAIASMVWLAVYLRQRWSPESKPVHAPHGETGR